MSTSPQIYFNPWDPEFRANPYPYYAPLLAGPPPVIELVQKIALIARYADVTAVLRDARFSADRSKTTIAQVEQIRDRGPFKGAPTVLTSDPPVHTRLRRLVSRDFTPRRIREIEPRIREITAQLLDAVQRKGELDVMADLANPLPVMVIAAVWLRPCPQCPGEEQKASACCEVTERRQKNGDPVADRRGEIDQTLHDQCSRGHWFQRRV